MTFRRIVSAALVLIACHAFAASLSTDGGKTWPIARLLHEGPAAYSCLAVLPNETICCLYECGAKSPYETIALAQFSLGWLMGDK